MRHSVYHTIPDTPQLPDIGQDDESCLLDFSNLKNKISPSLLEKNLFENLRVPLPTEEDYSHVSLEADDVKTIDNDTIKHKKNGWIKFVLISIFFMIISVFAIILYYSYDNFYKVHQTSQKPDNNPTFINDLLEVQDFFTQAEKLEKNKLYTDAFEKRIYGVNLYLQNKEFQPALEQSLKNEKILKTRFKDMHQDIISELRIKHFNYMAEIYYRLNQPQEAHQYSDQALRYALILYGTNHIETAKHYDLMAFHLDNVGDFEQALSLRHNSIDIRLKLSDIDSGKLITEMNNLGEDYRALGYLDESRSVLLKAIHYVENKFGIDAHELPVILNNLGLTEKKSDNNVLSMAYLQQAHKIASEKHGINHELTTLIAKNITSLRGFRM